MTVPDRSSRLVALSTVIIGCGVLGFILFAEPMNAYRSWRSQTWPVVDGQLRVAKRVDGETRRGGPLHIAETRYAFIVDGRTYEGNRRSFADESYGTKEAADAVLANLSVGQVVKVYYDPRAPSEAVLQPGSISGATVLTLLIFLLITADGVRNLRTGTPTRAAGKVS